MTVSEVMGADYFTSRSRLTEDGCLVWTLFVRKDGYAQSTARRCGEHVAHRASYRTFVGDIPDGYEVDHLCFNRACINPLHLEAVTPAENSRRKDARVTHCPHGHEYDEANTYFPPGRRRRMCRACGRHREAARRSLANSGGCHTKRRGQ